MKLFPISAAISLMVLISCSGDRRDDPSAKLNYVNTEYSFSLRFPEKWINYSPFAMDEIIDPDLKVDVVYFALPTRSREWQPVNVPAGYAAIFSVRIFTEEQWRIFLERYSTNTGEVNLFDRKIGESAGRIYMLRNSRSVPVDLYLYVKDIPLIAGSFRNLPRR